MTRAITGTYDNGVVLNNPTYEGVTEIHSGAYIAIGGAAYDAALLGSAGYPWRVSSVGTINGTGSDSTGVALLSGGEFDNGPGGVVLATQVGVAMHGGGYVLNTGTISSSSRGTGGGVWLPNGGTINSTGTVTAYGFGVYAGGNNGTTYPGASAIVATASGGTIASTAASGDHPGVLLAEGGSIVNSGLIESYSGDAIAISGAAGSIRNFGTVTGVLGIDLGYPGSTLTNYATVIGSGGTAVALDAPNDTVVAYGGAVFQGAVVLGAVGDVVLISPGASFQGGITGFRYGDTLDFTGAVATGYGYSGGVLTLYNGTSPITSLGLSLTTTLTGTYTATVQIAPITNPLFTLAPDGNGGTDVISQGVNAPTTFASTAVVTVVQGDAVVNQAGHPAAIANYGTITATGAGGRGVYLGAGGTVTNAGVVYGDAAGVAVSGGNATVVNTGYIIGTGAAGIGVVLGAGSAAASRSAAASHSDTLVNYGAIAGYIGVVATGGSSDTITNAGAIIGHGGTAVTMSGGNDRLVVDEGGTFQGIVDGGGGHSVLELAGGGTNGTLAGIGSSFVNFATLAVDAGAGWELSGDASGYKFINDGTIIVADNIVATGDTLVFGALGEDPGKQGVVELAQGGTADFTGAVQSGQNLVFADASGVLQLADPKDFKARITGFQTGDVIDIVGETIDRFTYAKGKLTVFAGGSAVAHLTLAGHYTKTDFQLTPDGAGGTDVTFAAGADFAAALEPGPPGFWVVRG